MAQMNAQELRDLATSLFAQVTQKDHELKHKQLKIDQLTHEMAVLKRWQFGRRHERLDPAQRSLLEETMVRGMAGDNRARAQERCRVCVPCLQRRHRAAPRCPGASATTGDCATSPTARCVRVDVSSSAWGKDQRAARLQARILRGGTPRSGQVGVPALRDADTGPHPGTDHRQGYPERGLLAHVLISKFADQHTLYRLEGILERSEVSVPRSTLARVGWGVRRPVGFARRSDEARAAAARSAACR